MTIFLIVKVDVQKVVIEFKERFFLVHCLEWFDDLKQVFDMGGMVYLGDDVYMDCEN